VDSEDAEGALCSDRPNFIKSREILKLIPGKIRKRITHLGDNAQIEGFQELFIYLNQNPGPKILRRLVVAYFHDTLHLRAHLSQSSPVLPNSETL
jgi:hypothetical protein